MNWNDFLLLIRDDGVVMTVEVQGDKVEVSFTFTEEILMGGRTKIT